MEEINDLPFDVWCYYVVPSLFLMACYHKNCVHGISRQSLSTREEMRVWKDQPHKKSAICTTYMSFAPGLARYSQTVFHRFVVAGILI